jgi:hypothetical protein
MDQKRNLLRDTLCASIIALAKFAGGLLIVNAVMFGLFGMAILVGPWFVHYAGGLFLGAYAVLAIVQRINRRDDPRHARRPSDRPLCSGSATRGECR